MSKRHLLLLGFLLIQMISMASTKDSIYASSTIGQTTFELKIIDKKLSLVKSDALERHVFITRLDSIVYSTGNPLENISMQFATEQLGFIVGNEMGYGYWPFVFRTTDGGLTWERQLFKDHEYGAPIYKEHFNMFNKQQGILIHNTDPIDRIRSDKKGLFLRYYLTKDGGKTWHKKKVKIAAKVIYRVENNPAFLHCTYEPNGKITVLILKAPWDAVSGKRSVADRTLMTLVSEDYGETFSKIKD
jgi:hypothetical protein